MSAAFGACRSCGAPLAHIVVDLGASPLANSYLRPDQLSDVEPTYPLRVLVCDRCLLVQLQSFAPPSSIFSDYAYFSSYSTSWLQHAEQYVAAIADRLNLGPDSLVVELASNDGYLLQYFVERGIPVLGIEPAANVAAVAVERGIPTEVEFFGLAVADRLASGRRADLVVANNVLAHVPDLNDFVAGMQRLLAPGGRITVEFPHLLHLLQERQFDTVYHEHFSYFSLATASAAFERHGLVVVDVEELDTHGGSLRVHVGHRAAGSSPSPAVADVLAQEVSAGLGELGTYLGFGGEVEAEKRRILTSLCSWKDEGLRIVGYGAPAKGNTLLNYCGIRTDFLDFTVDRSPHKQGLYLPGSRIPILHPNALDEARPDVVLILPWNLRDEVMAQLAHIRSWGGRFAARSPELALFP